MGTIWSDIVKEDILTKAWPLMNAIGEQLWSTIELTSNMSLTTSTGLTTLRYINHTKRLVQRGILNSTSHLHLEEDSSSFLKMLRFIQWKDLLYNKKRNIFYSSVYNINQYISK